MRGKNLQVFTVAETAYMTANICIHNVLYKDKFSTLVRLNMHLDLSYAKHSVKF